MSRIHLFSRVLLAAWAVLLASCGYRVCDSLRDEPVAVYVPYVVGDYEGRCTAELIRQLSESGAIICSGADAHYVLEMRVIHSMENNIGYEYDRSTLSGTLKKRLLANENRRELTAEIALRDRRSGELILGPEIVTGWGEYDYVNGDALSFLSFVDAAGDTVPVLQFSLGQLDSIEGAQVDVLTVAYRGLCQNVVGGLVRRLGAEGWP